ncbi:MAG: menaquinone biosynthesis decarboxylase [Phycisphaerales bacterium]
MYASLGEFVRALDSAGHLVRIDAPVDPVLEVAQITDLVSKARAPGPYSKACVRTDPRFHDRGGHALLFTNVKGADFPLLINAYGSYRRTELALGCADDDGFEGVGETIGELVKPEPPRSLGEAIAKARQFAPLLKIGPKRSKSPGVCQEVVRTGADIDLTNLPILRCWPLDGDLGAVGYPPDVNAGVPDIDPQRDDLRGRYITLAGIHTIHADDKDSAKPSSHNIGMYRVQLLEKNRLAMHWHVHHDGAAHWRSWKKRGERMPVAIALGGPSVMPYAATCPLPPGISELLMAGFLQRRGVKLCRCKTVPLWVPADSEIVIEGWVSHEAGPIGFDPRTGDALGPGAVFEGPFGDHTGFYSLPDRYPIVEVTAVTHRSDAVYPTTIVGLPPQEDYYLGKATERVMRPLLKTIIPDIADYDLPMFGAFHNCAALKIEKSYPLQGRRTMHAVWGAGQMSWTKTLFIVDDTVDPHDTPAVLRAAARHCHPIRDVETVRGPLDILDHAAPFLGGGTKMGFDCTPKWAGEDANGVTHDADGYSPMTDDEARRLLDSVRVFPFIEECALPEELDRGWLFVRVEKDAPAFPGPAASDDDVVGRGRRVIERLFGLEGVALPPFVVIVGSRADVGSFDDCLFHWCAHADPGRDAYRHHRTLAFDATPKVAGEDRDGDPVRDWPPMLEMDEATKALVERRWDAYGIALDS